MEYKMDNFRRFFRPGIVHFMAFPEISKDENKIIDTLKKIAVDEYFDAVEITYIKDSTIRKQARDLLTCAHMNVVYGVQPVLLSKSLNINDVDLKKREEAISLIKENIDQAYELGAEGFSFLSGRYKEHEKQYAFNLLVDSTERLCAYAAEKGSMKVELEVFDYSIDKKSLIGPADLAKKFAEKIRKKYENFGLLVDLSHIPLLGETPAQSIIPVKDFISHIHIGNCVCDKNSQLYGDFHPRFGFQGGQNDVVQLAEFLQVFVDIGFFEKKNRPIVSFEVKPANNEDPEIVISNSKRVLNDAWLLVEQV
jgi:sugar phosphate isomerase/epimerase